MKWRSNATEGDKWADPTRKLENGVGIVIEVNLLRIPVVEAMAEAIPMETEEGPSMVGVATNTQVEIMAVEVDTADTVVGAAIGGSDQMRDGVTGKELIAS